MFREVGRCWVMFGEEKFEGQGKAVETWLGWVMSGENEPGWMRFGEFR